jgi:hypothetical protein
VTTFSAAKIDPTIPSLRRKAARHWVILGLPKAFHDAAQYRREWADRNPNRDQEIKRRYAEKNREKLRARSRARYHENVLQNRESSNQSRKRREFPKRVFIEDLKSSTPCADCGQFFPAVCMDFDHLPGTKKIATIARMMGHGSYSLEELKSEISKCQLVCANCHRIRTWITRK